MTKEEIITFIFSKPEWKAHFIWCHEKLNPGCGCLDTSHRSFDNVKRVVTCNLCGREVKNWYPKIEQKKPSLQYAWDENGPVPFSPELTEHIKSVLRKEEENFLFLIKEKEPLLLSLKDNLTGETLSWLHHTHGIDPDLVMDILCVKLTEEQMADYEKYYEIHKKTGLRGFKPSVITVS
jgi:hypothetical protein